MGSRQRTKIYTRRGDAGRTALLDGARVPKDDLRVAAYGDVDELSAAIGLVLAVSRDRRLKSLLRGIQRDLFALGAQLADPKARIGRIRAKAALSGELVGELERSIDAYEATLPPLTRFIFPGGSPAGAALHLARTVCRRAERGAAGLARRRGLDPLVVAYLNRLSDLLFVLARHANRAEGDKEEVW